jgi:hypothetical protein
VGVGARAETRVMAGLLDQAEIERVAVVLPVLGLRKPRIEKTTPRIHRTKSRRERIPPMPKVTVAKKALRMLMAT